MQRSAAILAIALAACGHATPVPVVGAAADISRLSGDWDGRYSSVETGRSGSIIFHLAAGTDSSTGDVLMDPAVVGARPPLPAAAPNGPQVRPSQAIAITFVRVAGGRVSGRLDPYTDPDCQCPLYTVFEGALVGDTLSGTYASRHQGSGVTQHGTWRVVRSTP